MSLTPEDIRALVSAFETSDWDEMSLQYGDTRLDLSRNGRAPQASATPAPVSPPAPASGPAATAPTSPASTSAATTAPAHTAAPTSGPATNLPDGQRVTSPSLGLFWRSPQPGAPPFVEVGQQVGPEDTVCIVEVMKLMNHVKAGVAGTVVAINVDNGAMVEFGATLVVIEPEG